MTVQDTERRSCRFNPCLPQHCARPDRGGAGRYRRRRHQDRHAGQWRIAAAVADVLETCDTAVGAGSRASVVQRRVACWTTAGIAILKSRLIPRAMLVTPNLPEAEKLTGLLPESDGASAQCEPRYFSCWAPGCPVQGRAWRRRRVRDVLIHDGRKHSFKSPRQDTRHTHGTGCVLSTAIACGLAEGDPLARGSAPRPRLCAPGDRDRARPGSRAYWTARICTSSARR